MADARFLRGYALAVAFSLPVWAAIIATVRAVLP